MKKYLALVLSIVMVLSMSMTVCAATSPSTKGSSGSGSGSKSSAEKAYAESYAKSAASTGATAKSAAQTPAAAVASAPAALKSVAAASAPAQEAVQKAVQPVQKVVVNGQEVAAKVNVAAVNENATNYVNTVIGAIAPGCSIAQTFAFTVAGTDAAVVTTALNVPSVAGVNAANIRIVAFDPATGAYVVCVPTVAADGTIVVTVPNNCVLSVVSINQ